MTTQTPNIKWAERKDKIFLTIELNDVKDAKIDIVDERVLTFSGKVQDKTYELNIELFEEVVKADSKWTLDTRNIFLSIKKKTKGPYWSYLTKDKKKHNFIHIDWNLYIDEDEEDTQNQSDFGFPGMGGMGGMEGMGGMGGNFMDMGMGGDEMPDEDDELPVEGENVEGHHDHTNCSHGHKENKTNDLDDLDKAEENK